MPPAKHQPENWIQKYWRPAMAWQYFVICLFDFMFAPIMLGVYAAIRNIPMEVWTPLTLQGGSTYHIAMGAILGVSAWSRGQEKVELVKSPATQPATDDDDTK